MEPSLFNWCQIICEFVFLFFLFAQMPEGIMEDLYKHIESLGREHGYKNMTVLCKAAGVPRSTMSELNNGRSKDLSKPNAQKFADILGVTLDEVYGEETKKAPTPEGERRFDDDDLKFALWGNASDIDDEDLEDVRRYAAFVAERKKKKQ